MRKIAALIFPQFETLDLFGPIELFGICEPGFEIVMVAADDQPVASAQGPLSLPDKTFADPLDYDLLLVPGGRGTRPGVNDEALLGWIAAAADATEIVMSVCTGSALLAKAGVLDGKRATSNKKAFDWVRSQSAAVTWVPQARWVEDGDVFTSSGVSAGIDMSLAVIADLLGENVAEKTAAFAEYDWHRDPAWDPFAARYGLALPRRRP